MEGNSIGQPIDVTSFESAEGSLKFITDDAVNTGFYLCVDTADERVIYDGYVILTESECGAVVCRVRCKHRKTCSASGHMKGN